MQASYNPVTGMTGLDRKRQLELAIKDDVSFQSMVARASYEDRWKGMGFEGRGDLPGVTKNSWKYDTELSDDRRAIWYNETINTVLYSLRGTNFMKGGMTHDLVTDAFILRGSGTRYTPMYMKDREVMRKLWLKYPTAKVETIGHSLGGHRAAALGEEWDVKSIGFNEGLSPFDLKGWVKGFGEKVGLRKTKHTTHHMENDPISVTSMYMKPNATSYKSEGKMIDILYNHTDAMKEVFTLPSDLRICSEHDENNCL